MDYFEYRGGKLFAENVPVADIAAEMGTPLYIYSERTLIEHYDKVVHAFRDLDPRVCYSVKSCSNLSVLRLLAEAGSAFDIVSGGELSRVLAAGGAADRCFYAGVGKTDQEIRYALEQNIFMFNVESEAEFENIDHIAREMGAHPACALRINPDVDPETHVYTTTGKKETKFGVDLERAEKFFRKYHAAPAARLTGVHLHLGSPVYNPQVYAEAIDKVLPLIETLRADGIEIDTLDIGGGYAASYQSGQARGIEDYAEVIVPRLKDKGLKIVLEPGRFISANAGILVAQVQYLKASGDKQFVVVDTGMHHLIRPPLYNAFHFIWPVDPGEEMTPPDRVAKPPLPELAPMDVVGPICETGDFLARDRMLPPVKRGDLVAVFAAGAYAMAMASNYNSQVRPVEVMVSMDDWRVVRRRETYDDLVRGETGDD
jgi:diaminopimelate decarboxylase